MTNDHDHNIALVSKVQTTRQLYSYVARATGTGVGESASKAIADAAEAQPTFQPSMGHADGLL